LRIGNLNKRITIQKLTTTTNENGLEEELWQDYKTVWAYINNLFGKEYWSAKALNSEKTIEFTIRYSKSLEGLDTKKNRIKWKGKIYNITFIDNAQYSNTYLKIKGVEEDG